MFCNEAAGKTWVAWATMGTKPPNVPLWGERQRTGKQHAQDDAVSMLGMYKATEGFLENRDDAGRSPPDGAGLGGGHLFVHDKQHGPCLHEAAPCRRHGHKAAWVLRHR